jgi:polyisoprenoid-binding protein YceI
MTVPEATRAIDGVDLPSPGFWRLDPGHAEVGFIGRHFMLTKVRGRFTGVQATVTIGDRPQDSVVEATIDVASVTSGDATRDDHLRSPDLFDVDAWPTATFRSTDIKWSGRTGTLTGDLTIKGVTRPVTLDVEYLGRVLDPWGNQRIVFDAAGEINREDWGITWNMALDTGGLLVSKKIDLELHLELVGQDRQE